jgi:hypothetical protein
LSCRIGACRAHVRRAQAKPDSASASRARLQAGPAIAAIAIAALAYSTLPAQAAEVYRWTDERGVVNYSNEPPPKDAKAKDVRTVEDNLSVYTPEKRPERAPAQKPPSTAPSAARDVAPERRAPPPPPAPLAYDPCVNAGPDSNCYELVPYAPPVFSGRRPPRIVQPELPPGTIAGQSTSGGGTIPGQSGTTPAAPFSRSLRKEEPSASFTLKNKEGEREGRR